MITVNARPRSSSGAPRWTRRDRKSTRLNSSHPSISYAVFCLKKKKLGRYKAPIRSTRQPAVGKARKHHEDSSRRQSRVSEASVPLYQIEASYKKSKRAGA